MRPLQSLGKPKIRVKMLDENSIKNLKNKIFVLLLKAKIKKNAYNQIIYVMLIWTNIEKFHISDVKLNSINYPNINQCDVNLNKHP